MTPLETTPITEEFHAGGIVRPVPELAWVQSPDGEHIPCEALGPGVVDEVDKTGRVLVHWTGGGFANWIEATDIRSAGPYAHIITVYNRDEHGISRFVRRRLVTEKGLSQNWTVELLPESVVRTIRPDGSAWTFKYNWVFEKIEVWWPRPPKDDDAEALLVAELAVS